jgi:polysaccharide deacetylase 2 family uncharacterized protein YibQ
MARGFLAGVIWGTVISGVGLGALSLSSDLPPNRNATLSPPSGAVDASLLLPAPDALPEALPDALPDAGPDAVPEPAVTPPEPVTEAVPARQPDPVEPGRRPQPETGVDRPVAPGAVPLAPPSPVAVGADTTPLAPPVIGTAPDAPEGSVPDPSGAQLSLRGDAPVQPGVQIAAPGAPVPETQPIILTGPAQPPAPAVPQGDSALVSERVAEIPAPEAPEPAAPGPETPEAVPPVSIAPDLTTSAQEPDLPVSPEADGIDPIPPSPELSEPETAVVPAVVDPAPAADLDVPDQDRPAIGRPATSLFGRLTEALGAQDPASDTVDPPAELSDGALPSESPLVRFAAKVDTVEGVPRMAIVLIDDGSGPLGPSGLEAFPFPISFAIVPTHPDAVGAAAGYRALGFEVLVLGDMPEGATATDVEVVMAGLLATVPEAVAVLENPDGSLQENRAVASQVAAFLAESGHGLVMQPNGLNTAQKLALRDGVPAMTLFRDFDGEGQDTGVMRRTLDQAAFRARQEGGVVMMGRLRADTISALVLWGLQDRSDTIALVPVSTVLTEAVPEAE